jgi:hypothetical protein
MGKDISVGRLGRRFDLSNGHVALLTNRAHPRRTSTVYPRLEEIMDHNESVRKFEHLMLKQADHAREAAIELEALVSHMPSEKSRQVAELQVKASHKQAKEFRELAQKVHES